MNVDKTLMSSRFLPLFQFLLPLFLVFSNRLELVPFFHRSIMYPDNRRIVVNFISSLSLYLFHKIERLKRGDLGLNCRGRREGGSSFAGPVGEPLGGHEFQFLDNWSRCFDTRPHQSPSMRNKSAPPPSFSLVACCWLI